MSGLDAFNVIAGLVTICSAAISIWLFVRKKMTETIENEKNKLRFERYYDIKSRLNAISKNTTMIAALSDREEVSKKELKHLAISQLNYLDELSQTLERGEQEIKSWSLGIPDDYVTLSVSTKEKKESKS